MAGRISLRTFIVLVAVCTGVIVTVVNVAFRLVFPTHEKIVEVEVPVMVEPPPAGASSTEPATPAADGSPSGASLPNLRPVDAAVTSWIGKDLGTDKIKDAASGESYKVNVYQDAGKASANRAKVDLDRDDKWDEKWSFEADGIVKRQTSPDDDEHYTVMEVWRNGAWSPDSP